MKVHKVWFLQGGLLLGALLFTLGLAGCSTTDYQAAMAVPAGVTNLDLPPITVGDSVIITLEGPPDAFMPMEKPVTDDGTISMPRIGRIHAAGKTPGALEKDIYEAYVPKIYTHLTVTVKTSSDRVYFVRGEVKQPGRQLYTGPITVSKAITSAGDFNDFANRKNVRLIRSNGQHFVLNCNKILDNKEPDPPVYPGDQIEVKRRWW